MPNRLKARLRVLQETPSHPRQDCSICRNALNCWAPKIKPEHIVSNLLTCRIQRGIDVNRSSKLFLDLVRPKLKKYIKVAMKKPNLDASVIMADLESQVIEYLQHHYVMGEIAYPLHYLFGHPNGALYHYANNYAKKDIKFEKTHSLMEESDLNAVRVGQMSASVTATAKVDRATLTNATPLLDPDEKAYYDPREDIDEAETEETKAARHLIEDGVTLSLQEYRILKFCLRNAQESKRPLNGLHVYLSRTMNTPRTKVTSMFREASQKLVDEVRR